MHISKLKTVFIRRINDDLQQRFLDFNERQKKSDKEFYEMQLYSACDTIWKWRFIHGEISLHQYLIKERELVCGNCCE